MDELKVVEFHKLEKLLRDKGIGFETEQWHTGFHMCIPSIDIWRAEQDPYRISVITCEGSYGYKDGLIEIWAPGQMLDPVGYLHAEEAFELIEGILKGEQHEDTE